MAPGKGWPPEKSPFFYKTLKESEVITRSPEGFIALSGQTAHFRLLFVDSRRFDPKPHPYATAAERAANRGRTKGLENHARQSCKRVKNMGFRFLYAGYNVGVGQTQPHMHLHVGFNPFLEKRSQKAYEFIASHPVGSIVLRELLSPELNRMSLMLRPLLSSSQPFTESQRKRLAKNEEMVKKTAGKLSRKFRAFLLSSDAVAAFERAQEQNAERMQKMGLQGVWDGTANAEVQAALNCKLVQRKKLEKQGSIAFGREFLRGRKIIYAGNPTTPHSWRFVLRKARKALRGSS